MSNRTFESIPEFLQGKTIAITGTFPGVGKSYVKNNWVNKLRSAGYKVWNCGTTQKASVDCTVARKSLTTGTWKTKSIHKSNGFYVIDEAWMFTQEKIDELKIAYPNYCFILVGDPLQFDPIENGSIIHKIDFEISLTKQMRMKDDDLFEAIKMIKEGIVPIDFIIDHCKPVNPRHALTLTYTKVSRDKKNKTLGFIENAIVRSSNFAQIKTEDGKIENYYRNNSEWKNGELWEIIKVDNAHNIYTLRNISDEREISIDYDMLNCFFEIFHAANAHKVQGDTIKNKNIIVRVEDNCLFYPQNKITLLKYLYVTISRAQKSEQVYFYADDFSADFFENINNIKCPLIQSKPDSLVIFETDSTYLSSLNSDEIIDLFSKNISEKVTKFVIIKNSKNVTFSYSGFDDSNKNSIRPSQNLLTEVIFDDKFTKMHFVEKLSKQLDERPLQEVPGKGKCFISKNKMILNKASHEQKDLEEYHWFVFENDEMTLEEQKKYFLDKNSKTNVNKYIFRVIYSGNKSLHFWIYVKNAPTNVETYKKMAKKINEEVFGGKMCQSCINPAQLMRAPNVIRPDTGKVQEVIKQTRKVVVFDYSQLEEEPLPNVETKPEVSTSDFDNKVIFAFEMMRNDHDGSDGGRGKLILDKAYREKYTRGWTNEECRQLIELLCREWNCSDKISRLQKYFE